MPFASRISAILTAEGVDLQGLTDRLASYLERRGIGRGAVLAVDTPSSTLTALLLPACFRQGVTLFPLDPAMPQSRRIGLLQQAGVDFLISYRGPVPDRGFDPALLSLRALEPPPGVQARHLNAALIVATSGSAGEPKGVMLSAEAMRSSALAANALLGFRKGDCWLDCLPLCHIGGLAIPCRAALAGASLILYEGFDAMRLWRDLHAFPVTHLSLVPAMLSRLLDVAVGPPPARLRVILIGGDALNEGLAARALEAGWPLWVSYGMSETAALVAASRVEASCLSPPLDFVEGVECRVVEDAGRCTQDIGRIRLRGNGLMSGYVHPEGRPGEGLDGEGWFQTGDLGRKDGQGRLVVTGRADGILISGGKKVAPGEVERQLLGCPGILNAALIGLADPLWGQRLCACYEGSLPPSAVDAWCRENLQGAMRPRQFVRLDRLPWLSSGKIDRQGLMRHVMALAQEG
ncbi:MAG: AMP-binding protein [Gammaproteobacteria bacterium]|nr:AMP-binding protein [Gammaproteobacteria bacterium]MBU1653295.1 AMP-binding protein [Gammaproteobacteria bacterium]MBU1961521.1 AMP-binding protein [Gammaproteobacteria bacterium]